MRPLINGNTAVARYETGNHQASDEGVLFQGRILGFCSKRETIREAITNVSMSHETENNARFPSLLNVCS